MTLVHECIPCQHGNHDAHSDVVSPGIPGLIGSGQTCPCRGECRDRKQQPQVRVPSPRSQPERSARVEFWQRPDGYWHCEIEVKTATMPFVVTDQGDLFHDAGDCMSWAWAAIEAVTLRA